MLFLKAYLFGLTLALAIGPMALLIIQRCMTKKLTSAMATGMGIAVADGTLGLIGFSVGETILRLADEYRRAIHYFSGAVLLGLSLCIFATALAAYIRKQQKNSRGVLAAGSDFLSSYLLTLHNPLTIAVFLSFIGQLTHHHLSLFLVPLLACAVFLGSLTGQAVIIVGAFSLRPLFQRPGTILTLNILSALGIAAFGVTSLLGATG